MTTNPVDAFKAVATPPPELQRVLAYLAETGSDSVISGFNSKPDIDPKKTADRDEFAATTIQLSQQERLYQDYREQSQRINQATELALADASSPEERQEILEYQQLTQKIDQKIEQKREEGTLTQEDIEQAHKIKMDEMPKSVFSQYNELQPDEPAISGKELPEMQKPPEASFAGSVDSKTFSNTPSMNESFHAAVSDEISNGNMSDEPATAPITPSDLSKFTF